MNTGEKFAAFLVTAAIGCSIMAVFNPPAPDVHLGMSKTGRYECLKVIRYDDNGVKSEHDCSTIDLKNDGYNPVYVMDDKEVAEIQDARRTRKGAE